MLKDIVRAQFTFLFDELLSNLDAKLHIEKRSEIKLMHRCDAPAPGHDDRLLVFSPVNGKRVVSRVHPASDPRPQQSMSLLFNLSKAVLFDSKTEQRIA